MADDRILLPLTGSKEVQAAIKGKIQGKGLYFPLSACQVSDALHFIPMHYPRPIFFNTTPPIARIIRAQKRNSEAMKRLRTESS